MNRINFTIKPSSSTFQKKIQTNKYYLSLSPQYLPTYQSIEPAPLSVIKVSTSKYRL